jgi:hypothetical protein
MSYALDHPSCGRGAHLRPRNHSAVFPSVRSSLLVTAAAALALLACSQWEPEPAGLNVQPVQGGDPFLAIGDTATYTVYPVLNLDRTPLTPTTPIASRALLSANSAGNITWTSSDPAIATIDANGFIRAIAVGTVAIRATQETPSHQFGSAALHIIPAMVTWSVTRDRTSLRVGDNVTVTINAIDAQGRAVTGIQSYLNLRNGGIVTVVGGTGFSEQAFTPITTQLRAVGSGEAEFFVGRAYLHVAGGLRTSVLVKVD